MQDYIICAAVMNEEEFVVKQIGNEPVVFRATPKKSGKFSLFDTNLIQDGSDIPSTQGMPVVMALASAGLSFGAEKALKNIFSNGYEANE